MRTTTRTTAAIVLLSFLVAGQTARAQPVKPHILLIFDTSGSMIYPGYDGDGSPLCGGTGTGNRIYQLKQAIREAVLYVGTDEVNFGLARFPAQVNPNASPVCPQGRYFVVHDPSGPEGPGGYGSNSLDNSYDIFNGVYLTTGCKISTHVGETSYGNGTWFNAGMSESIVVPVTNPDPPNNYDPVDGNIPHILEWLDGQETASGGVMTNNEIRCKSNTSSPSNLLFWTPLGRTLFYARMYFENQVIANDAPTTLPCRNNIIILMTDGLESCDCDDGNTNNCSASCEFSPIRQACLLRSQLNVPTYVVTLPSLTGDTDSLAQAGGTGSSIGADFTDSVAVREALLGIIAEAVPSGEICNGVDDNCNGLTDEGVKNNCPDYPEWCNVELCNNQDDDCDGQTDEGLPPNACGGPCGAPVPQEICSGQDEDCDGLIDTADPDYFNGPDANCPCETELCDDVDNDCDGLTDLNDPDYQVPPGTCGGFPNIGECRAGHWECGPNPANNNTVEEHCVGAVGPQPEICDGLDNDCNGVTDDVAYNPPDCVVPNCQTGCCDGHWECVNAVDTCVPDAVGQPEQCNGLDDDCDSRVDEGAECAEPLVCFYGECVYTVGPDGCGTQYAVEGLCVDNPCVDAHCVGGETCDIAQGDPNNDYCYDPCASVTCDPSTPCDVVCDANGCRGECATAADCYLDPNLCADGEICEQGQCVPDACFGSNALDCGQQACRDGACVDSCLSVTCNADQECIDGQCVDMECDSTRCPPGRVCVLGQCAQDPCGGVTCPVGRVCRDGVCVDDPCRQIVCPTGAICDRRGQCVSGTTPQPDASVVDGAAGSDGGVAGDSGPSTDAAARDGSSTPQDLSLTMGGGGGCNCNLVPGPFSTRNPLPPALLLLTILAFAVTRKGRF